MPQSSDYPGYDPTRQCTNTHHVWALPCSHCKCGKVSVSFEPDETYTIKLTAHDWQPVFDSLMELEDDELALAISMLPPEKRKVLRDFVTGGKTGKKPASYFGIKDWRG